MPDDPGRRLTMPEPRLRRMLLDRAARAASSCWMLAPAHGTLALLRRMVPRDILFDVVPGDPGAHGPYSEDARGPNVQLRGRRHMRGTAAIPGGIAIGGLALGLRSAHRRGGITA